MKKTEKCEFSKPYRYTSNVIPSRKQTSTHNYIRTKTRKKTKLCRQFVSFKVFVMQNWETFASNDIKRVNRLPGWVINLAAIRRCNFFTTAALNESLRFGHWEPVTNAISSQHNGADIVRGLTNNWMDIDRVGIRFNYNHLILQANIVSKWKIN